MRPIRASEIGTYIFCSRAWWYHKKGVKPENQAELAAGSDLHARHGRQVVVSSITQAIAFVLLLVALVFFTAYCTGQLI